MTRKEIYEYIKKNNLGKEISKTLGYNWTNAKTMLLESFVSVDNAVKDTVTIGGFAENIYYNAIICMLASLNKNEVEKLIEDANRLRSTFSD